nr:sialin-like [Dermatophagoides farinae]
MDPQKKVYNGRFIQRFIAARVIFVILGFFGFFLVYAFKVVVNMSIVAMIKNKHNDDLLTNFSTISPVSADTCPGGQSTSNQQEGEFDWPEDVKNYVLASFFYGYVLTQIPAGILANKFGGKWIFGSSILIASIASLMCPFAARINYMWFIILRVIQGLAEGVVFPCMNTMIAQWMPKMERTRGTTITFTGAMIGTVITMPMAAQFNESSWGWAASYYLLGIVGIIWFILYSFLVYESPESHPFISRQEYNYIIENGGGKQMEMKVIIPYREIFTSSRVYGIILTAIGQNWAFLTILTYLPTYMKDVLHTDNKMTTIISGLPSLGQAVFGWICSYYTDRMRQHGTLSITTIRKINAFITYIPPAIFMAIIPVVGCDQIASSTLLILAVTLSGACFSGFNSTHVDMAPDFAGTLMGLTNSIGNIPGFIVPKVIEAFTKNQSTIKTWSYVWYLAAAINVLTTLIYTFMCTAEEQTWGRIHRLPEKA